MNVNATMVTVTLVFPTVDRRAVAGQVAEMLEAAVAAGGETVNMSVAAAELEDDAAEDGADAEAGQQ